MLRSVDFREKRFYMNMKENILDEKSSAMTSLYSVTRLTRVRVM